MSENSKTDGARTLGTRVRDWFNGGDPDGRAKLRAWATLSLDHKSRRQQRIV